MSIDFAENLINDLTSDLTEELSNADNNFNADLLMLKVKNAVREVISARRYPSGYTSDRMLPDLTDHYSDIRSIILFDYGQIGIEWQTAHTENGVSRKYISRGDLFADLLPISQF